MPILYENYITDDDSATTVNSGQWGGQMFTPAVNHTITSVSIKGYRITTNEAIVTLSIRVVDDNNKPTGDDLVSGIRALTDFPYGSNNVNWVEFNLGIGIALTAGIMYAICVRTDSASYSISWRHDAAGSTYDGGTYATGATGGTVWTLSSGADFMFKEYGGGGWGESNPTDKTYSKQLVTIGNNEVWYESSAGTMEELTAAKNDIDVTKNLDIVEAYGKVFIANGTNLKVVDFINVKLHTTDIKPDGKVYPRHGTVIEAVSGGASYGAKMVVDYITNLDGDTYIYGKLITTAEFKNNNLCEVTITEGDVSFTLNADQVNGPHWYDWTTYGNAAKDDNTYGTMPDQAIIIALYQGRLILAGNKDYPHMWYQSRQANPWNFLYGINDAQSAVAGNDADAGEIGDVVTAIIPYKDDFCIYGAAGSIWYLVGNAAEGGVILELSLTAGILASKAWCWDNQDNLYILATTGLLKIPKGFGIPENLTGQSYPGFIKDLDYNDADDRLTMGYDKIRHGIHICKTELADGTNKNWWYDLKIMSKEGPIGGLFPETFPEECGVCSMFYYESNDPDYKDLLFGCYDGYIRFSDSSAKDDNIGANIVTDVEAIDSHVGFGPLALAGENKEGKITSLIGILAGGGSGGSQSDSDDADYKIFTGLSAEKVLERLIAGTSPDIAGIISAPGRIRGTVKRQEIRGAFAGIRIGNNDVGGTWAMEKLLVNAKELGRIK